MKDTFKNIKLILTSTFSLIVLMASCRDKIVAPEEIDAEYNATQQSIYDFNVKDIDGNDVSLSEYQGKTMLIVNVASKCGHTPQYEDLQKLYEEYKNQDCVILGFPANNFLKQEPGTNMDIKQFCELNYGITLPMFSKISVKDKDTHPLYKYLTKKDLNGVLDAPVSWNFQKFLINKKGQVIASFNPRTKTYEEHFIKLLEDNISTD